MIKFVHDDFILKVKKIAKESLLPKFASVTRRHKSDGSYVTEADEMMQQQLVELLLQFTPNIPVLGEEMTSNEQQQLLSDSQLLWCIDPLDGTTNFSGGLPYFSISLALLDQGEAIFAMVYDPIRDESFTAEKGQGAYLNGKRLHLPRQTIKISDSIALIDFKKLPTELSIPLVTNPPYASQRSLGSVALDWCWLASNRCQLYLHSRQKLWDFAAGLLIFSEAGGDHSTFDAGHLKFDHLDRQTAFAAINDSLLFEWGEWLNQYDINL